MTTTTSQQVWRNAIGFCGRNPGRTMGQIARVILLVLFGIFMVVQEVNAFSGGWI
jgi:hypothetical protein